MKTLVIDDHTLFREGLAKLLQELDEGCVVLEANDCQQALELCESYEDIDLILLDLALPGMDGLAGLPVFRARYPQIPIVVVSATDDRDTVVEAIKLGGMGFIPKSSSAQNLFGALKLILQGGIYLPPSAFIPAGNLPPSRKAESSAADTPVSLTELKLTERQREVLALLIKGKPNKVIGRELGCSEGTVKIHVRAALKALNVTNRTQAILKLAARGPM